MVVVMQERATDEQVQRVISQLIEMGFDVHRSTGALRTVLLTLRFGRPAPATPATAPLTNQVTRFGITPTSAPCDAAAQRRASSQPPVPPS